MASSIVDNRYSKLAASWEDSWEAGRVIVHQSGRHAGLLRLNVFVPEFPSSEEADLHLRLQVEGELQPLSAIKATGREGRYTLLFYSPHTANTGVLPRTAGVCWNTTGGDQQALNVRVLSAEESIHPQREDPAKFGLRSGLVPAYPPGLLELGGLIAVVTALASAMTALLNS
jgi:hypothetical protein